jgi:hypothetical protein
MSSDRKDYTGSLEDDKNEISETVHFHNDLDKASVGQGSTGGLCN